ncbi:hypothetical protein EZV62_026033 [Acer yangbiense]|uniref:KIB1-4 beta-propeller domain-containing protein n=1 Tax=Acer yangbiense TaxID=1000413 RepID=A0A5C7GZG2_9ROSI|nr:hypothetical protein EZV62_026033 [Acer yangbiense]
MRALRSRESEDAGAAEAGTEGAGSIRVRELQERKLEKRGAGGCGSYRSENWRSGKRGARCEVRALQERELENSTNALFISGYNIVVVDRLFYSDAFTGSESENGNENVEGAGMETGIGAGTLRSGRVRELQEQKLSRESEDAGAAEAGTEGAGSIRVRELQERKLEKRGAGGCGSYRSENWRSGKRGARCEVRALQERELENSTNALFISGYNIVVVDRLFYSDAFTEGLEEDSLEYFYLVESAGELLVVSRIVELKQTFGFQVYKIDLSMNTLTKIEDLGDRILFLGHNSSISVSARLSYCNPNSIYFAIDHYEPEGYNDMGIYSMEDGSVAPYPTVNLCDLVTPPMWVEMNFI